MSRAIKILSFQNFYEVLKTCSAGRKDFFDTLEVPKLLLCNSLGTFCICAVEVDAFQILYLRIRKRGGEIAPAAPSLQDRFALTEQYADTLAYLAFCVSVFTVAIEGFEEVKVILCFFFAL